MQPGKLDHEQLRGLLVGLRRAKSDRTVLAGPMIGEDAAAIRVSGGSLVVSTDPVTFAADRMGWYCVQINANDVAVMGAVPRWLQVCLFLPAGKRVDVARIFKDVALASREIGVSVTGGHTEVTERVTAPILVGTMYGMVPASRKVLRSSGLREGDEIVMTGWAGIEATAILAREHSERLSGKVSKAMLSRAKRFLSDPGISVLKGALTAAGHGAHAMHDPTEGGVITGLWEMAVASKARVVIDPEVIPVREETKALCSAVGIDPLYAIASGSLLIGVPAWKRASMMRALRRSGAVATVIGKCRRGRKGLWSAKGPELHAQARDEIAKL